MFRVDWEKFAVKFIWLRVEYDTYKKHFAFFL